MRNVIIALGLRALASCDPSVPSTPGEDSTPTPTPTLALTSDGALMLRVDQVGEAYLLQGTYAVDPQLDSASVLRGRVVRFVRDDSGALALVERQHEASPDGEEIVLAEFGKPEAVDGTYIIDFVDGFQHLRLDFAVYQWWRAPEVLVADVADAEVVDSVTDGETLFWDTRTSVVVGDTEVTARLVYDLAPYAPPPDFEARPNNSEKSFFEVRPVATHDGDIPAAWAHRHDLRRGLTFVLTDNTPDERVRDIEVALGYWNEIFEELGLGRPLSLAEERTTRDAYLVADSVIAWDPDPEHGAARAQSVVDPLSGRIVRSVTVATPLFGSVAAEDIEVEWSLGHLERGEAPPPLADKRLAAMISDYFVNAYVHELGHALGFRHNFSASLDATLEPAEFQDAFLAYVNGRLREDTILASSVMEYLPTLSATLTGSQIRRGRSAYDYDRAVVAALYGAGADVGLTCEAEVADSFVDCAEYDEGREPFLGSAWQALRALEAGALAIARTDGEANVEERQLDGLIVGTLLSQAANSLASDAEFLALRTQYSEPLTESEASEYRARVLGMQQRWLDDDAAPFAFVFDALVADNADETTLAQVVADLVERVQRYAAVLGTSPADAVVDASVSAFVDGLKEGIEPALALEYAELSSAGG